MILYTTNAINLFHKIIFVCPVGALLALIIAIMTVYLHLSQVNPLVVYYLSQTVICFYLGKIGHVNCWHLNHTYACKNTPYIPRTGKIQVCFKQKWIPLLWISWVSAWAYYNWDLYDCLSPHRCLIVYNAVTLHMQQIQTH